MCLLDTIGCCPEFRLSHLARYCSSMRISQGIKLQKVGSKGMLVAVVYPSPRILVGPGSLAKSSTAGRLLLSSLAWSGLFRPVVDSSSSIYHPMHPNKQLRFPRWPGLLINSHLYIQIVLVNVYCSQDNYPSVYKQRHCLAIAKRAMLEDQNSEDRTHAVTTLLRFSWWQAVYFVWRTSSSATV